jgi:hypothetical protein
VRIVTKDGVELPAAFLRALSLELYNEIFPTESVGRVAAAFYQRGCEEKHGDELAWECSEKGVFFTAHLRKTEEGKYEVHIEVDDTALDALISIVEWLTRRYNSVKELESKVKQLEKAIQEKK